MNKVLTIITVGFILSTLFTSCCDKCKSENSEVGKSLQGNHKLLPQGKTIKYDEFSEISTEESTYFIKLPSTGRIKLQWLSQVDSTIINLILPGSQVRFKPCETCEVPTVKFKWIGGRLTTGLEGNIKYAIITCKPELIK